jgi:hypothetical protein
MSKASAVEALRAAHVAGIQLGVDGDLDRATE